MVFESPMKIREASRKASMMDSYFDEVFKDPEQIINQIDESEKMKPYLITCEKLRDM